MTPDQFHDALTLLPADLVAEAEAFRSRRPKVLPLKRYAAMAACFVLLLGIGSLAFPLARTGKTADQAAPMLEEAAAEAAPMEEAAPEEAPARGDTTAATALTEPPMLSVISGENALNLEAWGYTWSVPQEDGTTLSVTTDVAAPTDDPDRYPVLEGEAEAAALRWEVMPERISVRCWHREDLETERKVELHGATMPFYRGLHLYEVTAHWEQGTATYVFQVNTLR